MSEMTIPSRREQKKLTHKNGKDPNYDRKINFEERREQ